MDKFPLARIPLPTGVELDVAIAGDPASPPLVFLHGFPESHRTWRKVMPDLARDFRVAAPDQRGFGGSDKPEGVEAYKTDRILEDLLALADALSLGRFTLVGHDWGGAIAWLAALRHPDRIRRLVIVNAPHPYVFQTSLIEDEAQRAASQYMNAFRNPAMEQGIARMGMAAFYEKTFGSHTDLSLIPAEERQAYLDDWSRPGALTAMLNWYRASPLVVSMVGETVDPAKVMKLDPAQLRVRMPHLVIWGMNDQALLPVSRATLGDYCDDLTVCEIKDADHWVVHQKTDEVIGFLHDFLQR